MSFLQEALIVYGDTQVREGTEKYESAVHFARVLGDCILSHVAPPQTEEEKELPPETVAAIDLDKRIGQRRDEILREIFLGSPHKHLDVWGQLVEEPDPLTKNEFRRMAKTQMFLSGNLPKIGRRQKL